MTDAPTANKKSAAKSRGLLGITTTGLVTTSCVMAAAWCFLGSVWGVQSIHRHSAEASLQKIDALIQAQQTWVSPPSWINQVIDFYTHWRTIATQPSSGCFDNLPQAAHGFADFQMSTLARADDPFTQRFSHTCSLMKTQILPLLSGITAVIALRGWVFITALPLFLLSLGMGLVDGLVRRDIRKFQGARESALLFHRIKRCGPAIFFLPLFAYFTWLSPVSPLCFFMPMAVALGLWLALSIQFFKKYI